jgi:Bacterial Ig-like domain (group 1)
MHKLFSVAALAVGTMLLAGCGSDSFSGSGSGSGGGTGGTTATVASLTVTSSTATIPSDGSSSATISVIAKSSSNVAVTGATVTFATSAGNLTTTVGTTDSTGTATATLAAGTAKPGSTITVTATSGTATGNTTVMVANTQKTLTLLTSLPAIPSDGSKTTTITAYVRDANNNFVSGQTVGFQASSGGLTVTQPTTDASGAAIATLSSAGDPTNRTITVTAQAGGAATTTITVGVVGTKLSVSGPPTLVQGAVGTYTISLTDAGGNGIANQAVTITSAKGNTLSPATFTTDGTGQKTFTVTATTAGSDTLTVAAANLTATQAVNVSNQNFAFTAPAAGAKANLGVVTPVSVTWTASGVPQTGKTVSFSATRGTLSAATAVTDGNGVAAVTITSTSSGPSVISATATGVTAQASVDFIATTAASLKAQASPATIAIQGTSTITVTVRDAANNLVEGQLVNFSITQDSTGGSLSVASATTDGQGQASTAYTASTTTSASNGVVISATVSGTTVTGSTSLTVAGQTVFLSLGTGNQVGTYPTGTIADTQYKLPYSVQSVDNAGHGVSNVGITLTITSLTYGKGFWNAGSPWTQQLTISQPTKNGTVITPSSDPDAYTLSGIAGCKSEDINQDGILTTADDYNGNGHLDPGLIASSDVPSVTTDSTGSAQFHLIYPKDHAFWVGVRLTATTTVAGTQSSTFTDFWLPGLASDYATATTAPPGQFSPYGLGVTCKDPN